MKHKTSIRILVIIMIVISSFALNAIYINKKNSVSELQNQETSVSSQSGKNSEVMIWESLSRHLLSFN